MMMSPRCEIFYFVVFYTGVLMRVAEGFSAPSLMSRRRHHVVASPVQQHEMSPLSSSIRVSPFGADNDELDYDEDELEEDLDDADTESDWLEAELTLVNAPTEPYPEFDAHQVATMICRSLQFVDHPNESAGLERCFSFFTHGCRAVVTARQGAKTVERFVEYGRLAPALQPFMGATRVEIGEATYTEAKPPLRGAIVSFPIVILGAPILSLNHQSGMRRSGVAAPPITKMVLRLESQRRPPNQNCWMVREILDVRHAFAGDMGNAHVGG
jgi:hypothetical protein